MLAVKCPHTYHIVSVRQPVHNSTCSVFNGRNTVPKEEKDNSRTSRTETFDEVVPASQELASAQQPRVAESFATFCSSTAESAVLQPPLLLPIGAVFH